MTLPLHPTLGELRNEVLLRCGYSTTGNQAAGVIPVTDSYIAGSEKELFYECEWLKSVRRTSVDLVADNNVVDWPDESAPGEITLVVVLKENDDGTISRYEVAPGARLQERDASEVDDDDDSERCPAVYELVDDVIYLYPSPTVEYLTLEIDYRAQPSLLQETDRTLVDGELLVQRAVFKLKEYLALPMGQKEMMDHERYLARLRASNSQRDGIQLGGHRSYKTRMQNKNRVTEYGAPSNGFNTFHPW
jgi:hypothetical protein